MITPKDEQTANLICGFVCGAFITGSFLVDKKKANDIDVVVGESAFALFRHKTEKDSFLSQIEINGVNFECQESDDDDEYGDREDEMLELIEHWRGDGVNILVIRDIFLAAYKAAAYHLESRPKEHTSREMRVATHQKMKAVIRAMIQAAANPADKPYDE